MDNGTRKVKILKYCISGQSGAFALKWMVEPAEPGTVNDNNNKYWIMIYH